MSNNNIIWRPMLFTGDKGIFNIHATSSGIDSIRLKAGNDCTLPYISRSANNNGIFKFVDVSNASFKTDEGNCITIGLDTQTAFYQEHKFITGQNIHIVTGDELDATTALFISTVLTWQMKRKFNWGGNGATLGRLTRTYIMLPTALDSKPDWGYIGSFIQSKRKELLHQYRQCITKRLLGLEYKNIPRFSEISWAGIRLSDLGDIKSGRDIYKTERVNGNTPYITSGSANNGIGYFVGNVNKTLDKGYVGFNRNGSIGKAFFHPYYSLLGNDCRKIHIKRADNNIFVGQFIAMAITQQSACFSYSRKLGTARAKQLRIMLPVNANGEPDYEYMEQYAKNIMYKKYKQYLAYLEKKYGDLLD